MDGLQCSISYPMDCCRSEKVTKLAEDNAMRWVRTNYASYSKATSTMHEKYDMEAYGKSGGGDEYKPQVRQNRFFGPFIVDD